MPYTWGSDTSVNTSIKGYDYKSARRAYKSRSLRSVDVGISPVNQSISTNAENVIIVRIDVTGSNKDNAEILFDKLPLLYNEASRYLPDVQISFGAVGDANCDDSPLQIRDFGAGSELDDELSQLCLEGGGGGQHKETYELTAYYDLEHVSIPQAINAFYFLLCDEGFYDKLLPGHVEKFIGDTITEPLDSTKLFEELMLKFNVYILRFPYDNNEAKVHKQWVSVFGNERVILMDDTRRTVDCMLGLIGSNTGNIDDFSQRLSQRQTASQVKSVNQSLKDSIRNSQDAGKSVVKSRKSRGMRSKSLV